jgi:pyrimidine-nucleoside phosphorylase
MAFMAVPFAPVEVIERSRRGDRVDAESVESFVRSWLDGTSDDSLVSAWCMLACVRGLDDDHVEALARALIASGDRLELGRFGPTGDVDTTGGVGDTTPLVAAPVAAALGVRVAAMGGRGLAHTGGTADKLEAIPGLQVDLPLERFVRQVRDVGIAVAAQSDRLARGDRRLAELRDATGTVPAAGLVAASTMARKLAGGAGAVHLEVTFGSGAFLGSEEEARATAELMVRIAEPWGRRIGWSLCDMEQPLGRCVGNALEVGEAAEVLRGAGPADLRDAAARAAGGLAEAVGVVAEGEGSGRARAALADGSALAAAERWIEAQSGDPAVWTDPGALPTAPIRIDLTALRAGVVHRIGARGVGEVARWLGAGRLHPGQSIDPVVGVELLVSVGDPVDEGQPMAVIHARDTWAGEQARDMAAAWFGVGEEGEDA